MLFLEAAQSVRRAYSLREIDDGGKRPLSFAPSSLQGSSLMTHGRTSLGSTSQGIAPADHSSLSLAPILRFDLLDALHGLNADYLELLAAEHRYGTCASQLQFFPSRLRASFALLSDGDRQRLARTPYALYSLRFDDERFWSQICELPQQPLDVRYAGSRSACLQTQFCETALLQAYQTARTLPLAARLMYSMNESVRSKLAALPLWRIRRLAADQPSLLMPKWSAHACFWPDLLSYGAAKDSAKLTTVQLLGVQLIAAELSRSA